MLAFAAIFILMYCFEYLTPVTTDDFPKLRVKSLLDIWNEALALREGSDGRFGAWLFILWLLYIPHWLASAVLALFFCLLVLFVCMHSLGMDWKKTINWRDPLLAFVLLWLTVPAFGQVFFWRTGAYYGVNCALFLLFLWPYRRYLERDGCGPAVFLWLLPLALFLGLADYNTTLSVCLFALALTCAAFYRHKKYSLLPLLPLAVLLAGFYSAVSSWGTGFRANTQGFGQSGLLQGFVTYLRYQGEVQSWYAVIFGLILLCLIAIWQRRASLAHGRRFYRRGGSLADWALDCIRVRPSLCFCLFFFLIAQAAQMAFAFAAIPAQRAYTSSVVFMIIAGLCLYRCIPAAPDASKSGSTVALKLFWGLCAFWAAGSIVIAGYMFMENKAYADECRQISQSAPKGAHLCFSPGPFRSNVYLFCGRSHQFQEDPRHWMNMAYADHYGLGSVSLCPQNLRLFFAQTGEPAGTVRDDELFFSFSLPPEMAGHDFIFSFPPATRNPLRAWAEGIIAGHFADSAVLRTLAHRVFWQAKPVNVVKNGLTVSGTAKMPRVEHTDKGFIFFYEPGSRRPAAVPPLRLAIAGKEGRASRP